VCPLATLLATDQVSLGDVLSINWSGNEPQLVFSKEAEGAIVTSSWPMLEAMEKPAVRYSNGRPIVFPPAAALLH
jgi:hypothetical protein